MTDTEQKLIAEHQRQRQVINMLNAIAEFLYDEASTKPPRPGAVPIINWANKERAEQKLRNRYHEALGVIQQVQEDYPQWVDK